MAATASTPTASCPSGHSPSWRFIMTRGAYPGSKCLAHAITYRPVLRTALLTSAVVGTVLTAINQGNVLLDGRFPAELWWKIPLTYSVPYSVSTRAARRNTYDGRPPA
jgi:hypothetical protein